MNQVATPHVPNEILTTKLQKPPSRQLMVNRNNLIELINRNQDKKLCLVSAPVGFGKTTLVSQWAASSNKPVAWLSLDERDNDVIRFLTYLIEAIRVIFPTAGKGLLIALRSPQMPQINSVLSQLINEMDALQKAFTIVIDDYHLINNPSINEGLCLLVNQMPFNMNLIIISRDIPKLPLSKLRAKNQLIELNIKDLRFSDIESEYFLNQVMGLSLTKKHIVELEKRTEGWVVGLQLAALSIHGHKDITRFVETFSGSHSFIVDYLVDEVLSQLPEDIHIFLMATSILDRFSAPLCEAILSNDLNQSNANSEKIIEYLERNNLFIIPLDNERCWYRYHHLFMDLLRIRLEKNRKRLSLNYDIIPELHRRASFWYENNHFILEAFYHAVEANDIESASRLVEGGGVPLLYRGAATPVIKWLESLPTSVLDPNPSLRVLYGSALLFVGRVGDVEKNLGMAEYFLNIFPESEKNRNLKGHISAIRATLAIPQNDLAGIIKFSNHAIENLSPLNLSVIAATKWTLGYAYQMQVNNKMARQFYEEALKSSQAIGHFIVTILASIGLGNVFESENQLQLAKNAYKKVLDLAGHLSFPASSVAYLGLSRIAYQQNCIQEAQELIQKAIQLAQHLQNMDILAVCEIFHAKLKLAQGQISETMKLLKKASQSLHENNFSKNMYKVAQVEVRALLYLNDIPSAEHVAKTYDLPIEQIRVHLASDQPTQALSKLESMPHDHSMEILALRARAFFQAGNMEKAVVPLLIALEIAKTEGHIRVFLDEGAPMKMLLLSALQYEIMPDQISYLLEHFIEKAALVDVLTQRELDVLRLIAQGFTNQQICKTLFVSLNTIKGHNQRIFSKLQVKSRTEAILRAQELHLLT